MCHGIALKSSGLNGPKKAKSAVYIILMTLFHTYNQKLQFTRVKKNLGLEMNTTG
jgi:hypothetical protein